MQVYNSSVHNYAGSLVPKTQSADGEDLLWKKYDSPGWTGNGLGPKGVQPDPFDAEGMLFFKGWFALVMGIASHVLGPAAAAAKYDDPSNPWTMTGVDDAQFPYTFTAQARKLAVLFNANEGKGLH